MFRRWRLGGKEEEGGKKDRASLRNSEWQGKGGRRQDVARGVEGEMGNTISLLWKRKGKREGCLMSRYCLAGSSEHPKGLPGVEKLYRNHKWMGGTQFKPRMKGGRTLRA